MICARSPIAELRSVAPHHAVSYISCRVVRGVWAVSSRLDELFARYPEHLSVVQLAEVLGVKRTTAYKWLQSGVVPAYKLGGAWVILRDEVRDLLASGHNMPPDTTQE